MVQRSLLLQSCLFLIGWSCAHSTWGQSVSELPNKLGRQYVDQVDPSISDEFNAGELDTEKWGRRNTRVGVAEHINDQSLVVMESEQADGAGEAQYLSIKATAKNGPPRTAGIVSRASGYFGFYVVKFRYRGLDAPEVVKKKSIWHPSVWCAVTTPIEGMKRVIPHQGTWVEIDLMEWETFPHAWSSDAPARLIDSMGKRRKVITKGSGAEKAIMKDKVPIHDDRWQTIGLEYTPEYLKLWTWENGRWKYYSDREVTFIADDPQKPESKYTINTIGKSAGEPAFWILGNVISPYLVPRIKAGTIKQTMDDMSFDIDYFRYYRHNSVEDADWKWEKQLPNGG